MQLHPQHVHSKHTAIVGVHTLMAAYLKRPTVTRFVSLEDTIPAFWRTDNGRGNVGKAWSQSGGAEGCSDVIDTTATPSVRDYRALHCWHDASRWLGTAAINYGKSPWIIVGRLRLWKKENHTIVMFHTKEVPYFVCSGAWDCWQWAKVLHQIDRVRGAHSTNISKSNYKRIQTDAPVGEVKVKGEQWKVKVWRGHVGLMVCHHGNGCLRQKHGDIMLNSHWWSIDL